MQKNIFRTIAMMGLMMLAVASVQAQQRRALNINIPFDFTAGEKTLKAGDYTLSELSHDIYLVRSADRKTTAIVRVDASLVERDERSSAARVVFRKYEDRHFLGQVWLTTGADGRETYRSSAERRLSEELKMARNPLSPELVVITAAKK